MTGLATAGFSDNTSAAFHLQPGPGSGTAAAVFDNHTRVSNIITRGHRNEVWFAMSSDNASTVLSDREGDNISLGFRVDGTANVIDNGTRIEDWDNLTVAPVIAADDDSVYVMLGSGDNVTTFRVMDNATSPNNDNGSGDTNSVYELGSAEDIGTADTWCGTAPITGGYAVIVSDNGSGSGGGIEVHKAYDNGSTHKLTQETAHSFNNLQHGCAITMNGSRAYLALIDNSSSSSDNLSLWYSDNLTAWTQMGSDVTTSHQTSSSIAIGTIGTSSSGDSSTGDVWVAVNENGLVNLYTYESVMGGTTSALRLVTGILTGAGTSKVGLATDNSSVIAVTAVVSGAPYLSFWYNQ